MLQFLEDYSIYLQKNYKHFLQSLCAGLNGPHRFVCYCLVTREWNSLSMIRRLVVALLEEVSHWGWALRFQGPFQAQFSSSACRSGCSSQIHSPAPCLLATMLPAKIIMAQASETVRKPPWIALVMKSLRSNGTVTKTVCIKGGFQDWYLVQSHSTVKKYTNGSQICSQTDFFKPPFLHTYTSSLCEGGSHTA